MIDKYNERVKVGWMGRKTNWPVDNRRGISEIYGRRVPPGASILLEKKKKKLDPGFVDAVFMMIDEV
ncbi:MAG: hypothetical protein L0215_08180 [Gemmataceae bacterium]|nr:hypothetical protein [Gemmataceae bacterium]